ncbi:uncharacterized protein LOC129742918 [Uranotaenia lowii]|uniref:uncharacterized protein LOC129742918 n=1 Tax=Uranotaenia lowii TaxID=190385 RepID=UPI00247A9499|nr:uncharacterized protein LOC129742918 [Uranotaenia lowii]
MPLILGEDVIDRDGLVMIKRGNEVRFQWDVNVPNTPFGKIEAGDQFGTENLDTARLFKIDIVEEKNPNTASDIQCDGRFEMQEYLLEIMNKYRKCLAKSMMELGELEYTREAALNDIVEGLISAQIIEESESPCNSLAVLVPKKDNQFRMAVDYRQLNLKTIKDRFPMPDIEDCLNRLVGGSVFISIDLYSCHYQIQWQWRAVIAQHFQRSLDITVSGGFRSDW